jgi:primosomal protein N''
LRADVLSALNDVLSILEREIIPLRAQQASRQQTLSSKFDAQFAAAKVLAQVAAAMAIRKEVRRTVSEPDKKPIDALTEWSRWERDVLAFEPRP